MTIDVDRYTRIIWCYMHLNQSFDPCDVILALGSSDMRVAECAARLYQEGYGKQVVVSGGFGRVAKDRFTEAEVDMFVDIVVRMGVPANNLMVERTATNTDETITLTHALLGQNGVKPSSMLIVTMSHMERHTYDTFKKQWPETGTKLFVASPGTPYYGYFTPELPRELVINEMLGALQHISENTKPDPQTLQDIPPDVQDAYENLVAAGFDNSLTTK